MKSKNTLSVLVISSFIALSGCAESKTIGSTVGKGALSLVDSFATGVQKGIDESFLGNNSKAANSTNKVKTATTIATKTSNTITSKDMVYLFGGMEDACSGENPAYNGVRKNLSAFTESFQGKKGYDNFVKPRSEWLLEYRDMIKEIKYRDFYDNELSGDFGEYKVIFENGVKYRGQPLEQYIYKYRRESHGSVESLKFSSSANMMAIWPNFKSRPFDSYGDIIDMGAVYIPQTRTIACEFE
ncbi:hypothetical protein [Psychrobacter sp. Pi2-52]|uniref:hypothetical protein n=1 Tax=Psychrobacter sp. Pi2-52 TaxID=2774133 RepID=UPI0019189F73|nr:hypothetical protein [Psychrobacter sp. Pi2-52]